MKNKFSTLVWQGLDTILILFLSIPMVMRYTLWSSYRTPTIYFLFYFFMVFGNILYTIFRQRDRYYDVVKSVITWVLIVFVLGGIMVSEVSERGRIAQGLHHHTHDIVLQLEAAIRFLNVGKNPYKETYFGTPMESWPYAEADKPTINPALYHFVMPPAYLLSAYPFYFLSKLFPGYFDGRMPLYVGTFLLLFILFVFIKDKTIARIAIIITAFSPATIDYLIEGRSDMLVLCFTIGSMYFLERKHYIPSVIAAALACITKQTAWFYMPLYVYILYIYCKNTKQTIIVPAMIFVLVIFIIAGPFIVWDVQAYTKSTILYLSGSIPTSYPIAGYGLGMILYESGIIKDIHLSYPFWIWQCILVIPVYIFGFIWIKRLPKMSRLILSYGAALFIVWWAGRYFNNSHIAYISALMVIGVCKMWDETQSV